ncbi:hypothetical protein LguiA_025956 [Lonicera macranthoides]
MRNPPPSTPENKNKKEIAPSSQAQNRHKALLQIKADPMPKKQALALNNNNHTPRTLSIPLFPLTHAPKYLLMFFNLIIFCAYGRCCSIGIQHGAAWSG